MSGNEEIVSNPAQLQAAQAKRFILAGEMAFASMRPNLAPDGFLPQSPRDAETGWAAKYRASAARVYVAADPSIKTRKTAKYAFAIDGYLAWGLNQEDPGVKVLIGGGESDQGIKLDILAFSSGKLLSVDERRLPPRTSQDWEDSVRAVVTAISEKYPSAKIHQAAPLSPWGMGDVSYVGNQPLKGLAFHGLSAKTRRLPWWGIPAGMLGAGVLYYLGAMSYGYYQYDAAVDAYRDAVRDPIIAKYGGIDEGGLVVLRARENHLKTQRLLPALAEQAKLLASQLSEVDGFRIVEMRFPSGPARAPGERVPEFYFSIGVVSTSQSSTEQAKWVMQQASKQTGLTLRLVNRAASVDGKLRLFAVEGMLPTPITQAPKP